MTTAENDGEKNQSAAEPAAEMASVHHADEEAGRTVDAAKSRVATGSAGANTADADIDGAGWSKRFTRAWRDTVGAYATEEGETRNLLGRLVDFGTLSKDEAGRAFLQMRERIDENRRELDRRVDETLEQTISRFPFPTPGELQKLRERVRELEARIDELERS